MEKNYIKYFAILCTTVMLNACSKFIDVDAPSNRITGDVVFLEDATATAAVNGRYAKLITSTRYLANGGASMFLGMYADELTTNQTTTEYLDFVNSTVTASNSIIYNNFWRNAYENIYQINRNIEGLENSTALSKGTVNQLKGECYFLRAFCYWYLVNMFGDVPLTTKSDYRKNGLVARSPQADIFKQMKQDLLQARALLVPAYPSNGKFRANKFAATALLARVCLFMEEWAEAETYSTEVINSGLYGMPAPANAFLEASTEAIWQLVIEGQTFNTIEGNLFVPSTSATTLPQYPLTPRLRAAFEPTDLRLSNWVGIKTVSGTTYSYPAKYKNRGLIAGTKTEQPIVLRLAEQYLIRAEARAKQNKLLDAVSDIRVIRTRAGLTTTTNTTDQVAVLTSVAQERRVELFAEYGFRWFDIKRSGNINAIMNYKSGWQSTDALLPIPQAERLVNNNLTQNEGY